MSARQLFSEITRLARALRFWLLLLLAFAAWAGFGQGAARAQVAGYSCTYADNDCTPGEAHSQCQAWLESMMGTPVSGGVRDTKNPHCVHETDSYPGRFAAGACRGWPDGRCRTGQTTASFLYYNGCPEGSEWNEATGECEIGCDGRPNIANKSVRGSFSFCEDGCQYIDDSALSVCLGGGSDMYCAGASWRPTGQECQVDDATTTQDWNPNQETCRSTGGGWNECVKPNGDHCVTGAKGTRMCWEPGEIGQKNDTANIEWADRVPAGETPTPPANIENPTQETTTTDKGGVSGDSVGGSFVVSGGSGTGNKGGQSNTGRGGSGSGSGDGDGDGDGDGPGAPGVGVGDLYTSDDATISSVFTAFRGRIENAPIMAAGAGFLTVSASGACPAFTVPATAFWDAMSIDYHCVGPLADALSLGGALLMAIAAFIAWRAAFH